MIHSRGKLLLRLVALVALLALGVAPVAQDTLPPMAEAQTSTQIRSFDDLPPGLASAVARALQDALPDTYHLTETRFMEGTGFLAANPTHGMQFDFTPTGPQVRSPTANWTWGMELTGLGYVGAVQPVPPANLVAEGARLEYRRGPALTEWYLNTTWGLEQGFTLPAPPHLCPLAPRPGPLRQRAAQVG